MTFTKFCGLRRDEDVTYVNELKPEYIGFVFAKKSKRYVTKEQALSLREKLDPDIKAVGVFVNEEVEVVAEYLNDGVIDIAQLHGKEDETYIQELRTRTVKPIMNVFIMKNVSDLDQIESSSADYVLLDAGSGDGKVFDWNILKQIHRPYFLAGGISKENISEALKFEPYAIDVSSGIETDGFKDYEKMKQLLQVIRKNG